MKFKEGDFIQFKYYFLNHGLYKIDYINDNWANLFNLTNNNNGGLVPLKDIRLANEEEIAKYITERLK